MLPKWDVVVVGAGQAAAELVWTLRTKGFEGSIAVFGREPHAPYERPPLSKRWLLEEDSVERLYLRGADAYAAAGIELCTSAEVSSLDPRNCELQLSTGKVVKYGTCILAT